MKSRKNVTTKHLTPLKDEQAALIARLGTYLIWAEEHKLSVIAGSPEDPEYELDCLADCIREFNSIHQKLSDEYVQFLHNYQMAKRFTKNDDA